MMIYLQQKEERKPWGEYMATKSFHKHNHLQLIAIQFLRCVIPTQNEIINNNRKCNLSFLQGGWN